MGFGGCRATPPRSLELAGRRLKANPRLYRVRRPSTPGRNLNGFGMGIKLMAPLAIGDVVDGMAFGALAVAAGFGQFALLWSSTRG